MIKVKSHPHYGNSGKKIKSRRQQVNLCRRWQHRKNNGKQKFILQTAFHSEYWMYSISYFLHGWLVVLFVQEENNFNHCTILVNIEKLIPPSSINPFMSIKVKCLNLQITNGFRFLLLIKNNLLYTFTKKLQIF